MRIAMFGHKRIPSREGGVEIVVEELSVRMAGLGHQVVCLNRSGHHAAGERFDADAMRTYKGVDVRSVLTLDRKGLAAMSSSVFAAIYAAFHRFDIVHIHAEGPAFMCWLPKLMGKRVIVTIHGLDHQRAKWGRFAKWYLMNGEKNAVRFADSIIVLSKNVQQYFEDVYHRQTVFIPNGVSKAPYVDVDCIPKKWGLEKNGYILYLGRIVPEKGIHYLIEAFRGVQTVKKLVIAGGSSDTVSYFTELKKTAAEDPRIIFTDFVQGAELEALFSNAYLYCLPSDLEGMPLSLLEAMSYGNCCLVSDIPECAEVVEDKAVIFRRGNVDDLGVKLQMLCDSPRTVDAYKSQAADFVCKKYNWDDVVDKTLQLYQG